RSEGASSCCATGPGASSGSRGPGRACASRTSTGRGDGHRQVADRSPAPRCGRAPRRRAARALHQRHRAPAEGSHDHRQQREPKAVELPAEAAPGAARFLGIIVMDFPSPALCGLVLRRNGQGLDPCRAVRQDAVDRAVAVEYIDNLQCELMCASARADHAVENAREDGHPEPRTPPGVCLLQACGRARCGRCQHERHGR
ncbi:unnamed protein product, partial [Prorocentrum cordatum]